MGTNTAGSIDTVASQGKKPAAHKISRRGGRGGGVRAVSYRGMIPCYPHLSHPSLVEYKENHYLDNFYTDSSRAVVVTVVSATVTLL